MSGTKPEKLVCLGDSITWGFPYGPSFSWVKLASEALGFSMVNCGVNGDTVDDLLRRFDRDAVSEAPSHVFVMAGTNDASIGVSLEKYRDALTEIHEKSVSHGFAMMLGLPIPSGDGWLEYTLEKYRHWLKTYSHFHNLPLVDFSPVMLAAGPVTDPDCYTDEVHPSREGYRRMAGLFTEFCEEQF